MGGIFASIDIDGPAFIRFRVGKTSRTEEPDVEVVAVVATTGSSLPTNARVDPGSLTLCQKLQPQRKTIGPEIQFLEVL